MASAWQTVEEAALTLGISSRTLHRRLARGDFQARLENGRREVLVTIDAGVSDTSAAHESLAGERDDASDTRFDDVGQTSDSVRHAVLALHEDRIRRTDLAIMAYQQSVTTAAGDARRAHR